MASIGRNFYPITTDDFSIHAEYDALTNIKTSKILQKFKGKKKIINVSLVSIRYGENGKLLNAKPCDNCLTAFKKYMKKYNIYVNKVYYSIDNDIVCEKFLDLFFEEGKHFGHYQLLKSKNK